MKKLYHCLLLTATVMFFSASKTFAQPAAAFSAAPLTGCAPLVVNFTDNSGGNPVSWNWDLGNGTLSALKNPSTTYINPGTYTVTLTVMNAAGSGTITKTSYITIYDKPAVNFTVNDSASCIPFISSFTDLSTTRFGNITAWEWDFDDGNRSNEQNPSHSFIQAGNYNVSLKATNDAGCFNILNKLAYIHAADPMQGFIQFFTTGFVQTTGNNYVYQQF
jgi:PKD repeat protein